MGLCAVDQVVYSQRTERKFADGSAVLIGVSSFSLINWDRILCFLEQVVNFVGFWRVYLTLDFHSTPKKFILWKPKNLHAYGHINRFLTSFHFTQTKQKFMRQPKLSCLCTVTYQIKSIPHKIMQANIKHKFHDFLHNCVFYFDDFCLLCLMKFFFYLRWQQ